MVERNQIPHADDEKLAELVGADRLQQEAKEADEAIDWDGQRIREESVKLAIAGYEKMPETDLIMAAARIERYILDGYTPPEKASEPAAPIGGAQAFVENEDGTVTAV